MHRRTWRALLAITAIALVGTAVAGGALAVGGVKTYTGCLTVSGGTLVLIKEGSSPQKPCPSGTVQVRLSEGDITAVTAGTGLTGGGASGEVSLAIAASYRLPQGCATGKIAKWDGDSWECADDADTTYTAGDGLVLDGTEFRLDEANALPDCDLGEAVTWSRSSTSLGFWGCRTFAGADQSCASGKFANAVDADGSLTCGTPAGGAGAADIGYVITSGTPRGIPDDGTGYSVAELSPGAGTWLILATATLTSEENVDDGLTSAFAATTCSLEVDGVARQSITWDKETLNSITVLPFALNVAFDVESGFRVACSADSGMDGIGVGDIKLIGVKLGA